MFSFCLPILIVAQKIVKSLHSHKDSKCTIPYYECYISLDIDSVCDARIEGILLGEPTRKPTAEPTQIPTISARPTKYIDKGLPDGRSNFCGESYQDASENCSRDRHCPMGSK